MNPKEAVDFVRRHGIVLQSARGPVPNLAERIVGTRIRGSWWGHPKGRAIYGATQVLYESPEILVSKLFNGRVTFIHRRLWPALVKLSERFGRTQLARVWDEHTMTGTHVTRRIPFPRWVPLEVLRRARSLSTADAEKLLSVLLEKPGGASRDSHRARLKRKGRGSAR